MHKVCKSGQLYSNQANLERLPTNVNRKWKCTLNYFEQVSLTNSSIITYRASFRNFIYLTLDYAHNNSSEDFFFCSTTERDEDI